MNLPRIAVILASAGMLLLGLALIPQAVLPSGGEAGLPYAVATDVPDREVEIEDFSYRPGTIVVPVGTIVEWKNRDGVPHTVTSDEAGLFDSGVLQPDARFERRFDEAGVYPYHCSLHPSMTGTVIVSGQVDRAYLPLMVR
jgi:plastocyanin